MHANRKLSTIVTHPFAHDDHHQTGPYCGGHHHVADFHSDFISGSINHLKPEAKAGVQTEKGQCSGIHKRYFDKHLVETWSSKSTDIN